MLDDFFNIGSSSPSRRRKFLNALRNLSIALEMPIVISGTPETLNILPVDPSIANTRLKLVRSVAVENPSAAMRIHNYTAKPRKNAVHLQHRYMTHTVVILYDLICLEESQNLKRYR